jgi:hypothetical protein
MHGSAMQTCMGRSVFLWETSNFDYHLNQNHAADGDQSWVCIHAILGFDHATSLYASSMVTIHGLVTFFQVFYC